MKDRIEAVIRGCIEAQLNESDIEEMIVEAICEIDFSQKIKTAVSCLLDYRLEDYIESMVEDVASDVVDETLEHVFN